MLGRRPAPSYRRMTRRDFLRRSAGAAVALPSAAAILAACARPGRLPPGTQLVPLARQDSPVLLPTYEHPISTDTRLEEGATLKVYNWDAYMKKGVLIAFEEKFGVKVEWTTFNNMSEAIVKIATGQVVPDVFFPTVDYLARLVESKLLQPLNHDLIPNLPANMWRQFQDPFYDQQWRYTVPYTIYATGIAYRRDHVDDTEVSQKGYDILWDSKYRGKVGIYDDYREAIGMALLRRGAKEINTGDGALIVQAKDDIIDLMRATDARITINGVYAKIPEDEFWVHQSWSGDIVGAQYYLPKGVSTDVLDRKSVV